VKSGACKEVIQKFDAPPSRKEPWPKAPTLDELVTRHSSLVTFC